MDINIKPLYKLKKEIRAMVLSRHTIEQNADGRRNNLAMIDKPSIEEQIFRRRTKELDKATKMLSDVEEILNKHNRL